MDTVTVDKDLKKDLSALLSHLLDAEFDSYLDYLCDVFPEDKDVIHDAIKERNIDFLDKYAWNGTRPTNHVYAVALRIHRQLQQQGLKL